MYNCTVHVKVYVCIGPGKRGHVVATLLLVMFLGLRKLGNICCGHKIFLNKIRNICVRNKCCVRRQTGKHLCLQQCVLVCQGLIGVDGFVRTSRFVLLTANSLGVLSDVI